MERIAVVVRIVDARVVVRARKSRDAAAQPWVGTRLNRDATLAVFTERTRTGEATVRTHRARSENMRAVRFGPALARFIRSTDSAAVGTVHWIAGIARVVDTAIARGADFTDQAATTPRAVFGDAGANTVWIVERVAPVGWIVGTDEARRAANAILAAGLRWWACGEGDPTSTVGTCRCCTDLAAVGANAARDTYLRAFGIGFANRFDIRLAEAGTVTVAARQFAAVVGIVDALLVRQTRAGVVASATTIVDLGNTLAGTIRTAVGGVAVVAFSVDANQTGRAGEPGDTAAEAGVRTGADVDPAHARLANRTGARQRPVGAIRARHPQGRAVFVGATFFPARLRADSRAVDGGTAVAFIIRVIDTGEAVGACGARQSTAGEWIGRGTVGGDSDALTVGADSDGADLRAVGALEAALGRYRALGVRAASSDALWLADARTVDGRATFATVAEVSHTNEAGSAGRAIEPAALRRQAEVRHARAGAIGTALERVAVVAGDVHASHVGRTRCAREATASERHFGRGLLVVPLVAREATAGEIGGRTRIRAVSRATTRERKYSDQRQQRGQSDDHDEMHEILLCNHGICFTTAASRTSLAGSTIFVWNAANGLRRARLSFPSRAEDVQGPPFRRCESLLKSGRCRRLQLPR